jgi:hypothetical protein
MKTYGSGVFSKRPMRILGWLGGTVFSSAAFFAPPPFYHPQTVQSSSSPFSGSGLFDLPWGNSLRCEFFERYFERFAVCIRILGKMAIQRILKPTHCPFFSWRYAERHL